MVDLKGKGPNQGPESPANKKSARNRFRFCIKCKAKMMQEDWNALFLDVSEEVRKWVAFTSHGEGANHQDHRLNPSSARGSDKRSFGEEDGK